MTAIPEIAADHPRRLLKIREACERLGIRETKLREYINAGDLELVKLGAASRVPDDSIERFIAKLPRKAVRNAV